MTELYVKFSGFEAGDAAISGDIWVGETEEDANYVGSARREHEDERWELTILEGNVFAIPEATLFSYGLEAGKDILAQYFKEHMEVRSEN